jgi:hypothetical protein
MKFESPDKKTSMPNRSEAMARVQGIMGETMQLGANDSEASAFQSILERLQAGELTPVEAIREAEGVKNSKQDYH